MAKRFIESVNFPFNEVSEASGVEKGPGRPPHWEMVFWWTRKPLISARAIIAGCLLPENTNPAGFMRSIGITIVRRRVSDGRSVFEETPYRVQPSLTFEGVSLLDPFACFGSVPLEGLRLGLSVVASDLLPVGYVFLKSVLDYPAKYGEKLAEDVKKWGEWVTARLREDALVNELYEKDVAVYIGTWEVKCPTCGKWTPLIGNWWLARVKDKNGYKRLAWMEPRKQGDRIALDVMDLNRSLGEKAVRKAKVEGLGIDVMGEKFKVHESNIETRRNRAVCLHCDQPIAYVDPQTHRHIVEVKGLDKEVKSNLVWHVKDAIRKFYEGDASLAKQRLLIKIKPKETDLSFEPCSDEDQKKIELARDCIEGLIKGGDLDIPHEGISLYSVRYLFPILYGMTDWHKLFNSRQLLTLTKLVKLIREAGKSAEQTKIKEGLSPQEAFRNAEAVTTYLSMALLKFINYNSMTTWVHASNPWGVDVSPTLATRGIAMQWNWCEISPLTEKGISGIFKAPISWPVSLNSSIEGLNYLVSVFHGKERRIVKNKELRKSLDANVLLDDATVLGELGGNRKFDLIITDPPYYDDVPYSELSDFYFVWLKRTLSNSRENRLEPRFLPEAFFEKIGSDMVEVSTQWEKYALREVSLNPPRLGSNVSKDEGVKHFQNLLGSSFLTMSSRLKDDGLLVTYYAHTSPDAWKALLVAGWETTGLKITNAFPIATESAQSVVSRGKLSMDTSIVVVWRKGSQGTIEASHLYGKMVEEAAIRSKELMDLGATGRDLVVGTLAAALAAATNYREVRVMGKIDVGTLVDKYVYPASYLGLARALARKAELKDGVKSPDGMFYLLVKSAFAGAKKKTLDSTDARIFSIGTSLDLNAALKTWRMLAGEKEGGARVAKAKTLRLMEPTSADRSKLGELLEARGVGVTEPRVRCTVDALHLLEYLTVVHPRQEFKRKLDELKASYPAQVEDALNIARIMAKVLPAEDVEKGLCNRIIEYLEPTTPELGKFSTQKVN